MKTLIHCEASEGARQGFKTVGVPSVEGFTEYFGIEERFLATKGNDVLLPVRIIGKDATYGSLLVQLPVEADSGANRVWIKSELVSAS